MQNRRFRIAALAALLLALVTALILPIVGKSAGSADPQVRGGVMDLRNWQFDRDGALPLNGVWSLRWEQLMPEGKLGANRQPDRLAEVPGVWTRYGLPGRGYATYHVQVLTRPGTETLGLQIPAIAPAYKLFVDGHPIAQVGTVTASASSTHAAYRPQTIVFTPSSPTFDLDIEVANTIYPQGGIWFSLTLGEAQQMLDQKQRTLIVDMMVFGGCALLGLYQIAVYRLRHEERSTLYFGICCLLGAIREWVVGGIYIVDLFPAISIRIIILLEYLTYYGGVTMALLFVRELYPKDFNARMIKLLVGIGCGFIASIVLLPTEWYTRLMDIYKPVSLFSMAYLLFGFSLALWRGRSGALLQLFAWLLFVGAAVHDILYSDGRIIWLDMQLVPYGFILLVFMEAMVLASRFTNAYRIIETISDELRDLNQLKDEFLANTSHELKTPLHGILNLSLALSDEKAGPLNEAQKEQLNVVIAVARRMSNLVNDILDFSRLKNRAIKLELRSLDVRSVVTAQQEVFRHYIGEKPVLLRMDWPEMLPNAYADEMRLLQIMYNLIGNAIKFTAEGEVTVSARSTGGWLYISIADTGIGIPAEHLDTIFQSFEQVGTSLAREYGGAGLGLGITRQLVELHGGQISVVSEPSRGSVFTFTLPLRESQTKGRGVLRSAEGRQAEDRHAEGRSVKDRLAEPRLSIGMAETAMTVPVAADGIPSEHGQAILAVDDDPVNLRVLMSALADEPYRLLTAASGQEALALLDSEGDHIGLVILDVMMPGLSGYETCRRIRGQYALAELPVLLTTVRNEPEDLIFGFEAGANDFLTKPFNPHELRARARTLFEMQRSAEEAVRSEMAFLQAQIKPHFLYNALNTIVSLSLEEPQTAHDLLLHLSRYLRGSFDFKHKDRLVSLHKELKLTEAYLQIELARFGRRLQVRFEVDDGADCLLPPVSLQPLVENAVRHGVTTREEGGTVSVVVRLQADETVITVEDDGAGMSDTLVHTILSQTGEGTGGVGVRNIHQRLIRLYGRGLEIESVLGIGTKVTMRVPQNARMKKGADR